MATPSITRVVKFIRKGDKGDNAINIVVTNETVVFTKVGQAQKIYVEVYDGQTQIGYGTSETGFWCSTLTEEGQNFHYICGGKVYWNFGTEGNRFYYTVYLIEKADFNVEMPFTITYNNVEYSRSINFSTAYDGENGKDGNGIVSQSSLFVASNKSSGVTHENTTGWGSTFIAPTQQKPFIWKCVQTTYTKANTTYSTAELVATYQNGANPNLLDNAAFTDDTNLSAWNLISSYVAADGQTAPVEKGRVNKTDTKDGRNSFYDTCKYLGSRITQKEILQQVIHGPNVKKLVAGQWYTLSFWAKGYQQSIAINQSSSAYGFAQKELYLTAGRTYNITVRGYVSTTALNNGRTLRTYIYKSDWSESKNVEISASAITTKTMQFVPATTGTYYIQSYMYDNTEPRIGTVYVLNYTITDNRSLKTYIYPSAVDTSAKMFVDGVETTTPSDLSVVWALSSAWTFHTVSFKTASSLPTATEQRVLFRLGPPPCADAYRNISICMPKLEIGMMATGFIDTYSDVKGERGPALRGPQAWSDCLNGYSFQAGGDNEEWKDVVLYNSKYYSCIKSHAKTSTNYPESTEDTNNGYWKLGDNIELVATKILLATYALVKNLGVEAIDMKDSAGNVIFQAKDGNVVCNSGTFNNITVKGNSTLEGIVKASLFYGTTLTVTSATNRTYTIDPQNAPYNCFIIDEPTNNRFITLPKAADYDGLEIQIFTRLTGSWNTSKMTYVKCSDSTLYAKPNAYSIKSDNAAYSAVVEDCNADYVDFGNTYLYMCPNAICKFKSIKGAWYAIEGMFTGE